MNGIILGKNNFHWFSTFHFGSCVVFLVSFYYLWFSFIIVSILFLNMLLNITHVSPTWMSKCLVSASAAFNYYFFKKSMFFTRESILCCMLYFWKVQKRTVMFHISAPREKLVVQFLTNDTLKFIPLVH